MAETVATRYAVRVMGVWVRRADALIGNGSLSNAARAVELERARGVELERDLVAVDVALDLRAGVPRLPSAG